MLVLLFIYFEFILKQLLFCFVIKSMINSSTVTQKIHLLASNSGSQDIRAHTLPHCDERQLIDKAVESCIVSLLQTDRLKICLKFLRMSVGPSEEVSPGTLISYLCLGLKCVLKNPQNRQTFKLAQIGKGEKVPFYMSTRMLL